MTKSKDKSLGNFDANKDHKKVAPLVVSCACNRDITLDELADGYPDRKKDTLEKFLDSLNLAMNGGFKYQAQHWVNEQCLLDIVKA